MVDLKQLRLRLRIGLIVLAVIGVLSVGILLSPIGHSSSTGQRQLAQLWGELRTKDREVAPLRGIDQKIGTARGQIATFYQDRLPSSYAVISERLGNVAAANGVKLTAGKYNAESSPVSGLQCIRIDASIVGSYPQIVRFINALEGEKMFFLIDGIALGGAQGGNVQLQIKMETYLRSAGPERQG